VLIAVAGSAAVVVLAAIGGAVVVSRRRRTTPDETDAEIALRARNEQVAAQERATRFHPDAVRNWMRPR
jgi:anti-sigma-K factor RskA